MAPEVTVGILALICSSAILGALALYGAGRYREVSDQRNVLMFIALVCTCGLWALFQALELFSTTESAMRLWLKLTQFPRRFVAVMWLLFMLSYTDRSQLITWRTVTALAVVPVTGVAVSFLDPGLIWTSIKPVEYNGLTGLETTISPLNLLVTIYSYTLVLAGLLLAGRMITTGDIRHRGQGVALGLGAAVPLVASMIDIGGYSPNPVLNPVTILFSVTGILFGYAIFRYDMLELVPVAHREALETLPDVVVVFDEDEYILDMNPSGKELFGVSGEPAGDKAETLFATYPDLRQGLFDREHVDTEATLVVDGELKHFSVTSRPVELRDRHSGTLLILRDITELKEREQDLELLKRIQSRVLRHNIRNDLQVIGGLARTIAADEDGSTGKRAAKIVKQVQQLSETTEKAQQMESVIDASDDRISQDVCRVVQQVEQKTCKQLPEAEIEIDLPETAWVMAHGSLRAAVWNLTENAIVHSDQPVPEVAITVTRTGDSVTILVEDDGPGIPKHEINVLKQQSESALQHGSGAGLWLVNWIAEMSGGSLAFDTSGIGTTVHLQLPAANPASTSTEHTGVEEPATSSPVPEQ
jgi:PAS domain S-box-containing protein